jgi:hypothetical protein
MTYLSSNQIATKFFNNQCGAGETVNVKLTHKQSNWLMRQAEYDGQYKNNKAQGEILGNSNQVVGTWYCSNQYMRNNVFVLEVRMYQSNAQKEAHNANIVSMIENAKQVIAHMEQLEDNEYKNIMMNDMKTNIERLESQLIK